MKTMITLSRQFTAFLLAIASCFLAINLQAQPAFENHSGLEEKTQSVKLLSFSGSLNGNKADLNWVTEAEVNVSHFIIEKSTDGVNFGDAGVFFAYGKGNDKTPYNFSANLQSTNTPVVYYRLFVTGTNGKGFYSDICMMKTGK